MRNNNIENVQFDILDLLQIVNLYLGFKGYDENVNQGQMHDTVSQEMVKIQEHLSKQDNKIDMILELLGKIGGEVDG